MEHCLEHFLRPHVGIESLGIRVHRLGLTNATQTWDRAKSPRKFVAAAATVGEALLRQQVEGRSGSACNIGPTELGVLLDEPHCLRDLTRLQKIGDQSAAWSDISAACHTTMQGLAHKHLPSLQLAGRHIRAVLCSCSCGLWGELLRSKSEAKFFQVSPQHQNREECSASTLQALFAGPRTSFAVQ